jgi:hypothetical protein
MTHPPRRRGDAAGKATTKIQRARILLGCPMHAAIDAVRHKVKMMTISKALVVDDSKVVGVMFKRMLEARGLGVDTAPSGRGVVT